MTPFDYFYYRITAFYMRHAQAPTIRGAAVVTAVQMFIVFDLALVAELLGVFGPFSRLLFGAQKSLVFVPAAIIFLYNLYRYSRIVPYEQLVARWGDEDRQTRRKRGWLIALGFVVVAGVLVGCSILRQNLHRI